MNRYGICFGEVVFYEELVSDRYEKKQKKDL